MDHLIPAPSTLLVPQLVELTEWADESWHLHWSWEAGPGFVERTQVAGALADFMTVANVV